MKPRSVIVGLTLAFAMVATSLSAQERRPLDHPDYDVWNRIEGERLAPDGDWVVYALAPGDGDKTLVLRETRASGEWRRPRGTEARFTATLRPGTPMSDVAAAVDMNVVMTEDGKLIEVQGTAEAEAFSRAELNGMLDLAESGCQALFAKQHEALGIRR